MPAKGNLRPEIAVRSRIGQGPLPDREAAVRMTLARSPVLNAGTPAVKDDQTVSVLCPGFFIAITNSDHACSLPGRMRSPGKQPHQPTFSTLSAKNSLSFGPCSRSACGSGNGPSLGLALILPFYLDLPPLIILLTGSLAFVVSLGRIAMGVHYPLDVIAGSGIGIFGVGIVQQLVVINFQIPILN